MIIVKINVKKLLRQHFFEGDKGTYCDLVLIENKAGEDDWGNSHFVCQGVSKEDREAGIKGPIVGNAKTLGGHKSTNRSESRDKPRSSRRPNKDDPSEDTGLPF